MNTRLGRYWANKKAGLVGDAAGAHLSDPLTTTLLPGIGALPSVVGAIHGYVSEDTDVPLDLKGLIPGVGQSRYRRRMRNVRKKLHPEAKHQASRILSDEFSGTGNALLLSGLGAVVGGAIGAAKGRPSLGVGIGAYSGLSTAAIGATVGMALAAIKRKRTKEEQAEAEKKSGLRHWILPGTGAYDFWKRLGASTHFDTPTEKK